MSEQVCCCSVAKSCLTLCDPVDCSTPGFPVLHYLTEFSQSRVHRVGDTLQPSHGQEPDTIADPLILNRPGCTDPLTNTEHHDAKCQPLSMTELALEELALPCEERHIARLCSREAHLPDADLSGFTTIEKSNVREATVESVGRCAWDWYYKRKDWPEQRPALYPSL